MHGVGTIRVQTMGSNLVTYIDSQKHQRQKSEPFEVFSSNIVVESFLIFSKLIEFPFITSTAKERKSENPIKVTIQFHEQNEPYYKSDISSFSKMLYNDNRSSDIILKSKTDHAAEKTKGHNNPKEIHAHRLVLIKKLEYFDDMFSCGLSESQDNVIQFSMEFEALEIIIYFIYTGHIKDLIGSARFELWEEVHYNAKLMKIPSLPRIALWFSQCLFGLDYAFRFLTMCKESDRCGLLHKDVLEYLMLDWHNASKM